MSVVSTSSSSSQSGLREIRASTLHFQRSLRESAAPLQGICTLRESGNLVTYDEKAIRLWNLQKQIKSLHIDASSVEKWKFMSINALDEVNGFVLLYSLKKTSTPEERGGCLRLYSNTLQLIQEVDIKLPVIEKVIFAENQRDLIVLGRWWFSSCSSSTPCD